MAHEPLACIMDAIPEAERGAHITLASALFSERVEEWRDVPDGYAFRFPADAFVDLEGVVDGTLARWFTEGYRRTHHDVVDRIGRDIRATAVEGFAGCCEALAQIDVLDRLHEIRIPHTGDRR